jgi:hypothetical protein
VQGNCEKLLLCSDNLLEQMNNYAPRWSSTLTRMCNSCLSGLVSCYNNVNTPYLFVCASQL